ncbi:hypothetical protein [Streptomyces sp. NPDC048349]|uniref:glycoside hydrolase family 5 protein n=1 Tax=Streptomyces sp. NPDC048349 TaxID=3155486 RepID=UPI0034253148
MTVASAIGRHPALLGYDLMNEPFAKFLEGEDLPAAAARFEAGELTDMGNRLARATRLVDQKSWVFVEPTVIVGLGVPTRMGHIDALHAGYAPHFYDTPMETGAAYDPNGTFIPAYEAAISDYPTRNRMPVIVKVGRQPLRGAREPVRHRRDGLPGPLLQRLDGLAVVPGRRLLLLDQTGTAKPNARLLVQPSARAVAGDPLGLAYDPRHTHLHPHLPHPRPCRGPTQITVPEDTYPDGYRVTAQGGHARWDGHGQTVTVNTWTRRNHIQGHDRPEVTPPDRSLRNDTRSLAVSLYGPGRGRRV